jgi:hypothetical protein
LKHLQARYDADVVLRRPAAENDRDALLLCHADRPPIQRLWRGQTIVTMLIKVNEPPARRGVELAHVPAKWKPVRRQEHAPNDDEHVTAGVAKDDRPAEGTT